MPKYPMIFLPFLFRLHYHRQPCHIQTISHWLIFPLRFCDLWIFNANVLKRWIRYKKQKTVEFIRSGEKRFFFCEIWYKSQIFLDDVMMTLLCTLSDVQFHFNSSKVYSWGTFWVKRVEIDTFEGFHEMFNKQSNN